MKNNLAGCTEETCVGIVLKETLKGEGDKIVTVLTSKYGKIDILAKGVKNPKSKNAYAVQQFCYSEFELISRNYMYLLKTATIKDTHYQIRNDVKRFALASYFADIALTVCTENNDETEMLRLLLNSFYALSKMQSVPLWKIKAAFELKTMVTSGYMPQLSECGICQKGIAECANKKGKYFFSLSDGSILCDSCADSGSVFVTELGEDMVAAFAFIVHTPQSKMLSFELSDDGADMLSLICERYVSYHTGKDFKTLSFYKSITDLE